MSLVCLDNYEKKALEILPKIYGDYYKSGAEWSLQNNSDSFKRLHLLPKLLQDVSEMPLTTSILDTAMSMPVGISPTAYHKLANENGEIATAKAAARAGVIFTLSSLSSTTIEDVSKASDGVKWLQVYMFQPRSATEKLIRRAEKYGFKGIVLTVDSTTRPIVYANKRNNFDTPPHIRAVNLIDSTEPNNERPEVDSSLTRKDVKWLVEFTNLPVIAKGILRPEDAISSISAGCKAVWVSNHGGRLVESAPSPIQVLGEVVEAVKGKVPIILDSGVRFGSDVVKALALGADMVCLGRPILWGLAVNGQEGVEDVLKLIRLELENTMALCGIPKIKDISRDIVRHDSNYNN